MPVIGCRCRVCGSADPRDRRTRAAALLEPDGITRLLIDTPPELRLQLVAAGVGSVDAVFYTHSHADHVAGIDDLRGLSVRQGRVPVYGPPETIGELVARFGYIFDGAVAPMPGTSKPELTPVAIEPGAAVRVGAVTVESIGIDHGGSRVYGYRAGPIAYVTDAKRVPETALRALAGVDVLVLNALFDRPHPTHLSIPEAIEVAERVGARRTLLTHLSHRFTHVELVERLPGGVEPACDGLVVEF